MNTETYSRIVGVSQNLVAMLVERDYSGLEQVCNGVRLSATDIEGAVRNYGRTLCELPSEAWTALDVIEVSDSSPALFSVRVDLWTVEEGRSDLSLELTLVSNGESFSVEIDDLHVL